MKITFWIYLILCMAIGVIMPNCGYPLNSWQYWAVLACVIGAFNCGRFDERYDK